MTRHSHLDKKTHMCSKNCPRLYPDLSALVTSVSTSTLKHGKTHTPPFEIVDMTIPRLEPSAPPADIVSNASVSCCQRQLQSRSKSDLHRWSQWRSRLNEQLADYLQGSRKDVVMINSFECTFTDRQLGAIYNHAITKDTPSTCLASVPYLLYGIPRVKPASNADNWTQQGLMRESLRP